MDVSMRSSTSSHFTHIAEFAPLSSLSSSKKLISDHFQKASGICFDVFPILSCFFLADSAREIRIPKKPFRLPASERSISKSIKSQTRLKETLEGEQWLSVPFFEHHLKLSSGQTYWEMLRAGVNTALRLTKLTSKPFPKDGLFPLLFREKVALITRRRLGSGKLTQDQKWISFADLLIANRMLKEELEQLENVAINCLSEY